MEKKKRVKKEPKGEKTCEIFEIDKDGSEKTIKTCGTIPTEHADKEQIEKQNVLLKRIFIFLGVALLIIIIWVIVVDSIRNFTYKDIDFNVVKKGQIIFYHTSIPFYDGSHNHIADYNIYLRKDPRKLKDFPFNATINRKEVLVIESDNPFNCDGKGVIAVANLVQIFENIGTKTIKDPKAGCDPEGKYTFVKLQEANSSSIIQTEPSCYEFNIANCEILEVTEKFIVEALADIQ